jgi:endonuclease/exonuclease/phosphatase family metal-dependent hydrolase
MDKISGNISNFNKLSTLRVASCNVETLGETKDPEINLSKDEKLHALGETMEEMNADIVILQEVPSEESLKSYVSNYLPEDMYKYIKFFKTNDPSNHHMGILSRFPITETESNKDREFPVPGKSEKMSFLRDVSETQINVGPYPLRIYDVHFKANPYFQKADANSPEKLLKAKNKRAAEVTELKKIILEDMKRTPSMLYIVAGDMNAPPEASELQPLKEGFARLVDPMENCNGPEYISHPVTNNRLDYIMVSPELNKGVIPGSAKVHHSENASKASDHLGVMVDIDFRDLLKDMPGKR